MREKAKAFIKTHCSEEFVEILRKLLSLCERMPVLTPVGFLLARRKHHRNNRIVAIGDSHVNFFSGNEFIRWKKVSNRYGGINICKDKNPRFVSINLGPVLAYNSNRYGSSTLGKEKVDFLCNKFFRKGDKILCCYGEIDVRLHVIKQAEKTNRHYKEVIDDILRNNMEFLMELKSKGYDVWCWGPIASRKDSWPVSPEAPCYGTEIERNQATEYFNSELERQCAANGIGFASIIEKHLLPGYETKEELISDYCHLSQRAWVYAEEELKRKKLLA